jgi:cobalamin biosynthesis protein CobD/CbiB
MASSANQESPMRGSLIAAVALLLAVGTGGPHAWMIEGTNDRAMRQDMKEQVEDIRRASTPCPHGQSWKEACRENEEGKRICKWVCQ